MSPRRRSPVGANTVATGVVLLLLLFAVVVGMLPAAPRGEGPSARSTQPEGRRGLFLLLSSETLGYAPEAWSRAPGELPAGPQLLLLGGSPLDRSEAWLDADATEDVPARGRLLDTRHYRRFVDSGGTLLVPYTGSLMAFLDAQVGLVELRPLALEIDERMRRRTVTFASGGTVSVRYGPWSWFPAEGVAELPRGTDVLAQDEDGRAVALRVPVGRGAVALLAGDGLLDNRTLQRGDNALFCVRLLEELEPFERVLFDEFSIGGWRPPSPLQLAFGEHARLATLHVVALAALVAWRAFGRRVFPRDPAPTAARSALARAEGFAGLLIGRRRHDLLARLLQRATLRRLASRVGLRDTTRESDPTARVAPLVPERVEAVLARLGAAAEREGLVDRARTLLLDQRVDGQAALEQLVAGLDGLEDELQALHRARRADGA